jgi:hypothetical protein
MTARYTSSGASSGLQRAVGDLVDRDPRRDLDPQRGLERDGEEAARRLADERGLLRLQRVEEAIGTQDRSHRCCARYHGAPGQIHAPRRFCGRTRRTVRADRVRAMMRATR